jgi:hypothetical protein
MQGLLARWASASLLALCAACSSSTPSGGGSPVDGGASFDAPSDHGHAGPDATGSSSGGGSSSGSGAEASDACQTYADKAYACCQSEGSCGNVTRQTFVDYCDTFYAACQVYYTCFFAAATCAQADQCPTLGDGGCS